MEDQCFREYFGTSVHTAIIAWNLLNEYDKLKEGSEVSHMLWAMYFLKCYPLTQEACAAAGAADAGAVDPNTWKKHLWLMIYSLADLEAEVVSNFLLFYYCIIMFLTYFFKINFDDRRVNINDDTHLSVDCTNCKVQQKGKAFSSHKFAKKSGL